MRPRMMLELGATGLVLMLLVRCLYQPLLGKLREERARLDDLRAKIADMQRLAEHIPLQETALERDRERYRVLESRIDHGQSVARVLEVLRVTAKDRGLRLSAVQPRAKEDSVRAFAFGSKTILRETALHVQISGRYRRIAEFLKEILGQPFLVHVRRLTITKPAPGGQELHAELSLAVYLSARVSSR